jgi:hypothetical protein
MDELAIIKKAFRDELSKIAAVRTGSMPSSAATVAGKTRWLGNSFKSLRPRNLMRKTGGVVSARAKTLGTMGMTAGLLGVYGVHKANQAVQDYRVGKAMRERRG